MGDVSMVFGIAVVMLWLNWQLALVCLAAFPLIIYLSRFYRRRAREVYRQSRLILGRLNAGLQENIAGVATVQAFGQEERMYRRFQQVNLNYRDVLLQSIRNNAMFFPVIELFSAISVGLLLWYGGVQMAGHAVEAGVLVAFLQYIQRMYQPIRDLAEKYNIMQAAMASRRFSLLDQAETIHTRPTHASKFAGAVEFKNVQLSYQPGDPVLKNISFKIRPGEKVALVGATGGGKTSIISALCRFYDVDRGAILVDGIDVREWNKQELRRHLGLVLQDVSVFPAISPPTSLSATRASASSAWPRRQRGRRSCRLSTSCRMVSRKKSKSAVRPYPRPTSTPVIRRALAFDRRYSFSMRRRARWIPKPKR
jgi:ABC-type multidrug transport system fused ATPase/permease subunit